MNIYTSTKEKSKPVMLIYKIWNGMECEVFLSKICILNDIQKNMTAGTYIVQVYVMLQT